MGDRANIIVKSGWGPPVYLYDHWGGEVIPGVLRTALARRQRWHDSHYLTRIIFCEMIRGDSLDADTGPAIATTPPDNDHEWLIVDVPRQVVEVREFDWRKHARSLDDCPVLHSWTFDEYLTGTYRFADDEREGEE